MRIPGIKHSILGHSARNLVTVWWQYYYHAMSQAMSNSVKCWLIVVKYLAEINDYFVKMSSSYKTPQCYHNRFLGYPRRIYYHSGGVRRTLGQTQQHHPLDNRKFAVYTPAHCDKQSFSCLYFIRTVHLKICQKTGSKISSQMMIYYEKKWWKVNLD